MTFGVGAALQLIHFVTGVTGAVGSGLPRREIVGESAGEMGEDDAGFLPGLQALEGFGEQLERLDGIGERAKGGAGGGGGGEQLAVIEELGGLFQMCEAIPG